VIDPNDDFTCDDFMEDQHIDNEMEWEDGDFDRFADGDALASAGFGTDEDYGFFGYDE
jgi:hypothetical protein